MKTIVFITLQLSQPRCIKRISSIAEAGIPVKVYGFDSGLYNGNLDKLPFPVTEIIKRDKNIGRIKKILFIAKVLCRILSENKEAIFYLFGFELQSIAWLLGCRHFIYEEADVSASRIKNKLLKNVLLCYDKMLYRKAKLVISTSEGFIKYLFKKQEVPSNIELQPNKLHPIFTDTIRKNIHVGNIDEEHIRFGFIGLIRYPNTIIRFAKVVGEKFPMHEFHFYGDPEKQHYIDKEILSYKNVYFHGPFINPQDLQSIYETIDVNVVCYDIQSENVRIAEPNKLYESIYFKTPIVVSKGTFLAERVKKYGIGYEIDCANNHAIYDFVREIRTSELSKLQERMKNISTDELVDNPSKMVTRILTVLQ